jgi:hypothetical protein
MDQQHESSDFGQPSTQEAEFTSGDDERHHLIAETAYFIAEQRGFQNGDALEDWLQAEAKVAALQKEHQGDH